jgi:predicted RNase H-like HicB family nuclease
MHKYTVEIFYSEEDECFIAIAPDLPGCSAFGDTREEALKEMMIAMELWLEVTEEDFGRELPKPTRHPFLVSLYDRQKEKPLPVAMVREDPVENVK